MLLLCCYFPVSLEVNTFLLNISQEGKLQMHIIFFSVLRQSLRVWRALGVVLWPGLLFLYGNPAHCSQAVLTMCIET